MIGAPGAPAFLLGLAALAPNAAWRAAERMRAPVLVSANALSLWRTVEEGDRRWCGFDQRHLPLVGQHPTSLDSGGFVAAVRYRGYPWSVRRYMDLCEAAPWQWFALMDMCVEPEVARNRDEVLDRLARTVRLNRECLREARDRGIADRFVPVLQGWLAGDYLRCPDRMPDLSPFRLVGIGSMCRRPVDGDTGLLRVVDTLDRALGRTGVMFHLFGIKTRGMSELRGHPRIASFDSQAYGVAARQNARKGRFPKTNAYVAGVMTDWYLAQRALLSEPGYRFRTPTSRLPRPLSREPSCMPPDLARRYAKAAARMRELYEDGEVEWGNLDPCQIWAGIGDCELERA